MIIERIEANIDVESVGRAKLVAVLHRCYELHMIVESSQIG